MKIEEVIAKIEEDVSLIISKSHDMIKISADVLRYGGTQPLPGQVPLKAGPLALIYEGGDLRYIRLGDVEILRRVYSAVRDHNWNTIPPVFANEHIDARADSFGIRFDVTNRQNAIDFAWEGTITGEADGTITFTMRGKARSTFRSNRIGFCVLHPMICAGLPARIEHVDGSVEETRFPVAIAPQLVKDGHPCPVAPFDNLRALSHPLLPEVWAEVRFEGDTFEMEDQRNWTDGSFKTYCTPLSLPFPREVRAGTEIVQSIRLKLNGKATGQSSGTDNKDVVISIADGARQRMPGIGLGVASHGQPLTSKEIVRLEALHLSHLRIDLRLSDPAYKASLRRAAGEARALDASLEIALFLTDAAHDEMRDLATALEEIRPPVRHWLVFHHREKTTAARWVDLARRHLVRYNASARVGAGTNAYFTEINAGRPPVGVLDIVAYSINPQVHAFDNASLTETLAAQAETVVSTRGFAGGKPVVISPVSFKPRFNPNATGPEAAPAPGELPSQVDPRQSSLYGLAWTLGSLKYLAESGATSVTFYETSGWRGVMEQESGAPLPRQFFSIPGGVYPMYHLFADMAGMNNADIIPLRSGQPLLVDAMLLEKGDARVLYLANFTPRSQVARLTFLPETFGMRRINEANVVEAMAEPEKFRQQPLQLVTAPNGAVTIEIEPFETLRIDFPVKGN